MATNKYFINYNSKYEQNLIDDLVVETIKIHGLDFYYIPRELANQPDVFGDDPMSSFRQHFIIEMFIESVDGFEGDGDYISKFGLEIRDSAKFVVSKKRFQNITERERPLEGDLIFFPLNKKFFEIKFVEHENPFYQLGKNYVFSLSVELFQFSEENINTQIDEIDQAGDRLEYTKTLTIGTPVGVGSFQEEDTVYSFTEGATGGVSSEAESKATVVSYSAGSLILKDTIGPWKTSDSTTDRYVFKSGLYAKMNSSLDSTESNTINDNNTIENLAQEFLDFSELNPFGDLNI